MNKPRIRVVADAQCNAGSGADATPGEPGQSAPAPAKATTRAKPAAKSAAKPATKSKATASAKPAAKAKAKVTPKSGTTPRAKSAPKTGTTPKAKSAPKTKPEHTDSADEPVAEPGMVALPEEFTQPTLKALYERVSAQRDSGFFRGLDGGKVKRTDGAGVQFLLACFASPHVPSSDPGSAGADTGTGAGTDSDKRADTGSMSAPALIASEKLLGAIAALGARHLLDSYLVEAVAADADITSQKLAA